MMGRPSTPGETRAPPLLAALLGGLCLLPGTASAHPEDQYLQGSYVALAPDHVTLEVDLTPGIQIGAKVLALIDMNQDGQVSETEKQAYADAVLKDLILEVDKHPCPLSLKQYTFPESLARGQGGDMIRLELTAPLPSAAGDHHLFYQNNHQPLISLYQANAFMPKPGEIKILGQKRDPLQRGFQLDYTLLGPFAALTGGSRWMRLLGLSALLALGGLLAWRFRPLLK